MKRDKIATVMLTKEEEQQLMNNVREQFAAGKCRNKSDYIRQMLGLNGSQPTKDSELDKSNEIKEEIVNEVQVNKEAVKTPSKLAIDFGKLEI